MAVIMSLLILFHQTDLWYCHLDQLCEQDHPYQYRILLLLEYYLGLTHLIVDTHLVLVAQVQAMGEYILRFQLK